MPSETRHLNENLLLEIKTRVREITDPIFDTYLHFNIEINNNELTIYAQRTADRNERTLVLKVFANYAHRQICIPNIFMPLDLRGHGYGKAIIAKIFEVASAHGYKLFVIDLVESFHKRLVNRNAIFIDDDTVQIIEATRLT